MVIVLFNKANAEYKNFIKKRFSYTKMSQQKLNAATNKNDIDKNKT